MTVNYGGNIGSQIAQLARSAVVGMMTSSLAIVTDVDLNKLKVDIQLKSRKDDNIVKIFSCPVVTQSYSGGGMVNFPRVGDLVVALYCKYDIEQSIKEGSLKISDVGEVHVSDQNYAFVIGTIYPLPESIDPKPASKPSEVSPSADSTSPEWPPFNRDTVYHGEKVTSAQKFMNERLEPAYDHQVWLHPYDHEIRMTREEIHIKHKTGTQVLFRENGDLEMYMVGKWMVHACDSITLNSEQSARMNSYVPHKIPPWRV